RAWLPSAPIGSRFRRGWCVRSEVNSRRILPSLMVTASFAVESVSFAHGSPRTPVDTRGHRMSYDVDRCHLSSQTALPPRRGPDTQKETLTRGAPDQIVPSGASRPPRPDSHA